MKKIFSFVIVLAAVAMISCGGNAGKKATAAEATDETRTEECCAGKADSCKCEKADSCKKAEGGECCKKAEGDKKAETKGDKKAEDKKATGEVKK